MHKCTKTTPSLQPLHRHLLRTPNHPSVQARRHTQAMRMTLGANTPSWQSSLVLCTATQGQLLIFKWRNLRSGYHESIDSRISANLLIRFSNPLTPKKRSQLVEPHYLHEDDLYRMACLIFEGILNIEGLAELGLQQGMSIFR